MKKPKAKPAPKAKPIEPKPECCGCCHFWRDERCRRYPPVKRAGEHIAQHRDFTTATDWCGEFKRVAT